jgi:oligogalacturonide transporter
VLMREIQRFKEQPDSQPDAESRAVVENLTGWRYEALWGKQRLANKSSQPGATAVTAPTSDHA